MLVGITSLEFVYYPPPLHLEVTPGNLGGKDGGDSFLPEGLCAAFGPRWVGTCIRVLLGLQGPAGSADVGIYIYIKIFLCLDAEG